MMLKLCGAILIISGTTCYGFFLSFQKKSRIARLLALKETFIILIGQIRYARTTIPEAFQEISKKCSYTDIGNFYEFVAVNLKNHSCQEFSEAWNMGINTYIRDIFLTEADCTLLKNVGNMPLYLDAQMQIAVLEETSSQLQTVIEQAQKDIHEKCKIYQSFGLIIGLLIVLILI